MTGTALWGLALMVASVICWLVEYTKAPGRDTGEPSVAFGRRWWHEHALSLVANALFTAGLVLAQLAWGWFALIAVPVDVLVLIALCAVMVRLRARQQRR